MYLSAYVSWAFSLIKCWNEGHNTISIIKKIQQYLWKQSEKAGMTVVAFCIKQNFNWVMKNENNDAKKKRTAKKT